MAINIANRPYVMTDSQLREIYDSVDYLARQLDYDGSNNLIYSGAARPGASTGAPKWQICKLTYDVSNNLTSITWPINSSGAVSSDFEFIWTSRAGYTYA